MAGTPLLPAVDFCHRLQNLLLKGKEKANGEKILCEYADAVLLAYQAESRNGTGSGGQTFFSRKGSLSVRAGDGDRESAIGAFFGPKRRNIDVVPILRNC